jgi:hypothetical protein
MFVSGVSQAVPAWREGKALGSEEGKSMESGLHAACSRRNKLRVFTYLGDILMLTFGDTSEFSFHVNMERDCRG